MYNNENLVIYKFLFCVIEKNESLNFYLFYTFL